MEQLSLPIETLSQTNSLDLSKKVGNDESNAQKQSLDDNPQAVELSSECAFCRRYVDAQDESTYFETVSWVHGKKKDSSVLRKYTGRKACSDCIALLRSGIDPRNEDLLGSLDAPATSDSVDNPIPTDSRIEEESGILPSNSIFHRLTG